MQCIIGIKKLEEGGNEMNRKKKEEIIKNFTVVLYPSTMEEYLKLKEQNKWTHDEAIKELIKTYKNKEEK